VVDASGNLRVPGDYRTAYQFLGSWAVAVDQGQGAQGDFDEETSPFGAKGLRELTAVTVASAIADIVYRAPHRRVRHSRQPWKSFCKADRR
jgi:hypothetical protein